MFENLWKDLQYQWRFGGIITKLIGINIGVFLFFGIVRFFLFAFNGGEVPSYYTNFIHLFCIKNDWFFTLTHPYSIITHQFLHEGLFHLLFNMLYLFWFGRILMDLSGPKRIVPIYIWGGIMGAIFFYASSYLFNYQHGIYALGASAAVMAIVLAAATLAPNYNIRLLFIGNVKLMYLALALVVLDIIFLSSGNNTGGRMAHLGGALFGYLYISIVKRNGVDIFNYIHPAYGKEFMGMGKKTKSIKRKPTFATKVKSKSSKALHGEAKVVKMVPKKNDVQSRIDDILDKINSKGIDSLSAEEKAFLEEASKN